MATEAWLEAARNYNRMNDQARAEYWNQLTPEQQGALRDALASSQSVALTSPVSTERASAPARRGCSSPLAAGCIGMVLGSVITLAAEVAAIMMGVGAVSDAIKNVSDGSSAYSAPAPVNQDSQTPDEMESNPFDLNSPEGMAWRKRHQEELEKEHKELERRLGQPDLDN